MAKMTLEIPEFKKCCFCLPLRAGLLTWGYLKLIADLLITPVVAYGCIFFFAPGLYFRDLESLVYAAFLIITLIAVMSNLVVTIIFIIGGHKKKVNQIRGFYIYSIYEFIVMTVLIVVAVGITIKIWRSNAIKTQLIVFTIYLLILVLHAYILLLLKSEVKKLQDISNGRIYFVNNLADVKYTMTNSEKEPAIVKGLPNEAQ